MKIFSSKVSLFICILLSIVSLTHSQQWYEKGNPHFIDEQGFYQKVKNAETRSKGVVILKFFTPWCRYCRYLKDIIDKLKTQQNWSITIYEVNCDSQSHTFCKQMEVMSYPKISVFEDGQFQQSMDGFYPYQVVRQLFVKYNRTVEASSTGHEQKQQVANHLQKQQTQKANFIDPVVIPPEKIKENHTPTSQMRKEAKRKQQKNRPKQEQTKIKQHKVSQTKDKTAQPQSQSLPSAEVQPQVQAQVHNKSQKKRQSQNMKKSQSIIEQEQNIAITDQNKKETEQQKKIAQQVQKQSINLIDLTKVLPQSVQVHQYGKYIMYGICLMFGCYYFMHIMKGDGHSQGGKEQEVSQQGNQSTKKSIIRQKVSIQDSELRQELDFEHLNEEQINLRRVEVRDEDL